jgi:PPOX class probable F420-dependent enzyme
MSTLSSLKDTKTVLLTTYKRDGTPVGTPVSIAFDGDRAFFRSYDKAWKTKRLRNNPNVEVAPATVKGRPSRPGRHCSTANRRRSRPMRWRAAIACCTE